MTTNYGLNYEFLSEFDINSIEIDANRLRRWAALLGEWIKTDSKAVKITCKNKDEKKLCRAALREFIRRRKLDWTVYPEKASYNVYVVRA